VLGAGRGNPSQDRRLEPLFGLFGCFFLFLDQAALREHAKKATDDEKKRVLLVLAEDCDQLAAELEDGFAAVRNVSPPRGPVRRSLTPEEAVENGPIEQRSSHLCFGDRWHEPLGASG
jgi:hypothetical protein